MSEIRIYDASFNFKGIIENQTSLLWRRRYFETGEFEIYCPITPYNLSLIQLGNIVWKRGAVEAGVIESINLSQNNIVNQITVKGRFLESYMDRRLIRPTYTFNNELVEVCMRTILSNAVAIPLVQLGTLQNFTERVSFQATYKNLLAYESKLSKYSGIGFRFAPDFDNKTITFQCYKGLDRTMGQSDRNRVIFSEQYNNISEATYSVNSQIQKTVCYVGGEGEGSERKYVVTGDNSLTGLERRELFLNAADISSEDLTTAQYENALKQRGNNALETNALSETFEAKTEAIGNFTYRVNYDLGDIVTIRKNTWGIATDLRISEITEAYENGALSVIPTFGNPLPETIDWEDES